MIFSDPDRTFHLVSDLDPFSYPKLINNILYINFTFVFLSCVVGCILWRDMSFLGKFFFDKEEFKFLKLSLEKLSNFISFFFSEKLHLKFISDPELLGFRKIFPDPDHARNFGSIRIRIYNTDCNCSWNVTVANTRWEVA